MYHRNQLKREGDAVSASGPAPLPVSVLRTVRFEETDPLGIVWHGRYPSYLEDARMAFGEKYGLDYLDMFNDGFTAPVAKLSIDYLLPLKYPEKIKINAQLRWTEAVRLDFSYVIFNEAGEIASRASTVQLLTEVGGGELILAPPPLIGRFRKKWREGAFCEE